MYEFGLYKVASSHKILLLLHKVFIKPIYLKLWRPNLGEHLCEHALVCVT
jgi:hypothetical protein